MGVQTNLGTILFEEGPLYCETGTDIFQAVQELKNRLLGKLPHHADTDSYGIL